MRVVVAGPRPSVRLGVALILADHDDWSMVEVADLDAPAGRTSLRDADVLVLDLDPFDQHAPTLRRAAMTGIPVIVLSTSARAAQVARALDYGAAACLAKETLGDDLIDAVQRATGPSA